LYQPDIFFLPGREEYNLGDNKGGHGPRGGQMKVPSRGVRWKTVGYTYARQAKGQPYNERKKKTWGTELVGKKKTQFP